MRVKRVIIHADGSSRGNPGPAAIGATVKDEQGRLVARISQRIGTTTNNQAEYRAIIAALEEAIKLGVTHVKLNSDSELVVRQINGRYRVKNAALKPLYQRAKQLQNSLEDFTITHIPRQQNTEADSLANKALDIVKHCPAESHRLIIKISQTSDEDDDIGYLHKLIGILRDFPGQDEVALSVTNGEKVIILRLSHIYINYCPELRKRLVELVGKKGLRVEPANL